LALQRELAKVLVGEETSLRASGGGRELYGKVGSPHIATEGGRDCLLAVILELWENFSILE